MMRFALPVLCSLLLAACSALTGPRTQFTVFTLNPPAPAKADGIATADWHLAIDEPHALGLLDSDRLVIAPDDNERMAFGGVRWSERAPVMLQDVWLRAFEADGRIAGVVRSNSGTRTHFALATDLLAFQVEHGSGQPEAVVGVRARLVEPRSRRNLVSAPFQARVPASNSEARSAVEALEAATAQVTTQLIAWAAQEGQRATVNDAE